MEGDRLRSVACPAGSTRAAPCRGRRRIDNRRGRWWSDDRGWRGRLDACGRPRLNADERERRDAAHDSADDRHHDDRRSGSTRLSRFNGRRRRRLCRSRGLAGLPIDGQLLVQSLRFHDNRCGNLGTGTDRPGIASECPQSVYDLAGRCNKPRRTRRWPRKVGLYLRALRPLRALRG